MKHTLITIVVCLMSLTVATARTNKDFYEQFASQLQNRDSVAVAATIKEWERSDPSSVELTIARVNYYYLMSMGKEVVVTSTQPPKGNTEYFMLKDSLGRVSGYMYSELQYNEDMFGRCMDTFRKGIADNPDRVDLREGQVTIYLGRGMYDKANDVLLSMVARSKVNGCKWTKLFDAPVERSEYYDALQDYFAQLVDGGCEVAAVKSYVDALGDAYPDNPIFRADKAYVFLMLNDTDAALAEYKAVFEMDPSDMLVATNIAYLCEMTGDTDSAKLYYGKVASGDAEPYLKQSAREALERLESAK